MDSNKALRASARAGIASVVQAILQIGDGISDSAIGWALEDAASCGYTGCVALLLATQRVDGAIRGYALRDAARHDHRDCAQLLAAEDVTAEEVTVDARDDARYRAEEDGYGLCAQIILEAGPVHEEDLEVVQDYADETSIDFDNALRASARGGIAEAVEVILELGVGISDSAIGLALEDAASRGYTACVALLLATQRVDGAIRGYALRNAARNDWLDCVQLLAAGGITTDARGNALGHAAYEGHTACADVILESGEVTDEDLAAALDNAWWRGCDDCREHLALHVAQRAPRV